MNRFFRRSLLGLLCSTALLTVSCKDKNTTSSSTVCANNPGTCQSVLEAKDFFAFKVGSWWVYEEENSHLRDSMFVTYSENNTDGYYFRTFIESSLTGYTYRYWPIYYENINGCNVSGTVSNKCLYIKLSKGKPMDLVGESYVFFVKYGVGDFVGAFNVNYENNLISVENILDSYSINNLHFTKTVKLHELSSHQESDQPINTFYAKNVGIVRKELLDSNQVWNLVAYHIEQ